MGCGTGVDVGSGVNVELGLGWGVRELIGVRDSAGVFVMGVDVGAVVSAPQAETKSRMLINTNKVFFMTNSFY